MHLGNGEKIKSSAEGQKCAQSGHCVVLGLLNHQKMSATRLMRVFILISEIFVSFYTSLEFAEWN